MKNFLLMLALTALAGCGFTPLYATNEAGAGPRDTLDRVEIGIIPDSDGQILRNLLIDRFYSGGWPDDPSYILSFTPLEESIRDLDITKSSDATRAQLTLVTEMSLREKGGAVVLKRKLNALTSYNILQSQFTTRVAEDAARRNALTDLARQTENELLLYFNRRAAP